MNLPAPPVEPLGYGMPAFLLAAGVQTSLSMINGRGEPLAASKPRLLSLKLSRECFVHQPAPFRSHPVARFPNDSCPVSQSTLRLDHRERKRLAQLSLARCRYISRLLHAAGLLLVRNDRRFWQEMVRAGRARRPR